MSITEGREPLVDYAKHYDGLWEGMEMVRIHRDRVPGRPQGYSIMVARPDGTRILCVVPQDLALDHSLAGLVEIIEDEMKRTGFSGELARASQDAAGKIVVEEVK